MTRWFIFALAAVVAAWVVTLQLVDPAAAINLGQDDDDDDDDSFDGWECAAIWRPLAETSTTTSAATTTTDTTTTTISVEGTTPRDNSTQCTNFWQLWYLQIGSGLTNDERNSTAPFHATHPLCFEHSNRNSCGSTGGLCSWCAIEQKEHDAQIGIPSGFCLVEDVEEKHMVCETLERNHLSELRKLFNSTYSIPPVNQQARCMGLSLSKADCEAEQNCSFCDDVPDVYGLRSAPAVRLPGVCHHTRIMDGGLLCDALKDPPRGAFDIGAADRRSFSFALAVAVAAAVAAALCL